MYEFQYGEIDPTKLTDEEIQDSLIRCIECGIDEEMLIGPHGEYIPSFVEPDSPPKLGRIHVALGGKSRYFQIRIEPTGTED